MRAQLTALMTDEQILRAIGVDPAVVKLKPPPEGYNTSTFIKTAYTNETMDIEIDRMPSRREILVVRMDQGIRWIVKDKKP
jgi:hypothetical protein